ncbi:MAG: DUF1186 domain-containing protein [Turicibacter sp.]|nr:DUF1186 domain-containing protein [Turicibacter sp.]
MTKQEILAILGTVPEKFSDENIRAAIAQIRENKAEYIPELLDCLEYIYRNAAELTESGSDYDLHSYAIFLLAEFREKRAFSYMINFLRLPEEQLDYLFDDLLHEDLPKVLVSTFDDAKIQSLTDIIEDTNVYEFARVAAIETYQLLYKENFIDKTAFVAYLRGLIYEKLPADDEPFLFSCIANAVMDSHTFEMMADVQFLHDNDRVDRTVYGDYDDFVDYIFNYDRHRQDKSSFIENTLTVLDSWIAVEQRNAEYTGKNPQNTTINAKIGRNDPCPCGSGKKYKKCCYNTQTKEHSDLLKNYPKEPIFYEMYDAEAIEIDKLVYKALHSRRHSIFDEINNEAERIGKIGYLQTALDLFIKKCEALQIANFAEYDKQFMIHYRASEWVKSLVESEDSSNIRKVQKLASEIFEKFS